AVASPKIVSLNTLSQDELQNIIDHYSYNAYPVIKEGKLEGVVSREGMKDALLKKTVPKIHQVGVCFSDQTVKEVGNKFIEYDIHMLIVLDKNTNSIKGIITLHDLIRAQSAVQS
ncbi:MAG: CBS domain-containing protein, partial [Candidatus Delongbacteria bacterium]|nr:CBS domain-containing protein [Candidatus Delongbacteria bacterium]